MYLVVNDNLQMRSIMAAKKTMVSIWIKPDILSKLDAIAQKAKISRSRLMINLIGVGYDEMKLQKNLGIIKLTLSLRSLQLKISQLLKGVEKQVVIEGKEDRGTNVSVRIDNEAIKKIDDLASKIKMSRSTFLEYILEFSIREARLLDFVHITDGAIMIRDISDTVKTHWKKSFKESEKTAKEGTVISGLNGDIENH